MNDDFVQKILLDSVNLRVIVALLNESYTTILQQHHYPQTIAKLVKESLLCSALLAANFKFKGELTLQIRQQDPLQLLVAKCTHDFKLRALAQWDQHALFPEDYQSLTQGQLVITMMPDDAVDPYQSIVPLSATSIQNNLEAYFQQSEQLSTRFFLSSSLEDTWGVLIQLLPGGDPQQLVNTVNNIHTACQAASASYADLLSALRQSDPNLQIFQPENACFSCRCNQQKMEDAVLLLGEEEINEILAQKASIEVTCEYCNHIFQMTRNDIEQLKNTVKR